MNRTEQAAILRRARRNGYLRAPRRAFGLIQEWYRYCKQKRQPYVVARCRRKYAAVELDTHGICVLDAEAMAAVRTVGHVFLFAYGGCFFHGETSVMIPKVPLGLVPGVVATLLLMVRESRSREA